VNRDDELNRFADEHSCRRKLARRVQKSAHLGKCIYPDKLINGGRAPILERF